MTNFDANNHYEDNILRIEKFEPHKIWCAIVKDADQNGLPYIKRFLFEMTKKKQSFIGENPKSELMLLTDAKAPRLLLTFGGNDEFRGSLEVDVNEFALVKGYKAKGKRLTTFELAKLDEIETDEPVEEEKSQDSMTEADGESDNTTVADAQEENLDPDAGKSKQQVIDEITGQLNLFDDDNG